MPLESEQQAESALSQLQEEVLEIANSSIFTSAMIVDLSSHIDKFRYDEINSHIDECQCEIPPSVAPLLRAQTSHRGSIG